MCGSGKQQNVGNFTAHTQHHTKQKARCSMAKGNQVAGNQGNAGEQVQGTEQPKFLVGTLPLPTPEQLAAGAASKGGRKFQVPGTSMSACKVIQLIALEYPNWSAKAIRAYLHGAGVKVALATVQTQAAKARKGGE